MSSSASTASFVLPANHGLADKPTALAVELWHATTAPADCTCDTSLRDFRVTIGCTLSCP